jgi:hypothetical protein
MTQRDEYGEIVSALAGTLIADSIRRAADAHIDDVEVIAYALQVAIGYWLNKAPDRERLTEKIDAAWPEIKSAQLEERGLQ